MTGRRDRFRGRRARGPSKRRRAGARSFSSCRGRPARNADRGGGDLGPRLCSIWRAGRVDPPSGLPGEWHRRRVSGQAPGTPVRFPGWLVVVTRCGVVRFSLFGVSKSAAATRRVTTSAHVDPRATTPRSRSTMSSPSSSSATAAVTWWGLTAACSRRELYDGARSASAKRLEVHRALGEEFTWAGNSGLTRPARSA